MEIRRLISTMRLGTSNLEAILDTFLLTHSKVGGWEDDSTINNCLKSKGLQTVREEIWPKVLQPLKAKIAKMQKKITKGVQNDTNGREEMSIYENHWMHLTNGDYSSPRQSPGSCHLSNN